MNPSQAEPGKNGVTGIIVPVADHELMHKVFHGTIVYRIHPPPVGASGLKPGNTLFFYDPDSATLEGEARIVGIAHEDDAAAGDTLVIHFADPVAYSNPMLAPRQPKLEGRIVDESVRAEIFSANS